MKALHIIETAYRATLEEQDDPVVWITHAMKGAGADLGVVLRGNAVNYAVKGQEVAPLVFGARKQKHGPRLADDVAGLIGKGVDVYVIKEDLAARGLDGDELIDKLKPIGRAELPGLFEQHDQVWHW
ncbi:MAG TPA: DsrH/TusB family sulfur metabolism protein [Gammaproteobacteria bacterium]|nr:DsrH/TusB family sulfur metabolism protein [Gammaproteobacteria bacterium]